jgi:hypothetical protein
MLKFEYYTKGSAMRDKFAHINLLVQGVKNKSLFVKFVGLQLVLAALLKPIASFVEI